MLHNSGVQQTESPHSGIVAISLPHTGGTELSNPSLSAPVHALRPTNPAGPLLAAIAPGKLSIYVSISGGGCHGPAHTLASKMNLKSGHYSPDSRTKARTNCVAQASLGLTGLLKL